jgi:hypothetical protein
MVDRGLAFLASSTPDEQLGAKCLVGMVFSKLGQPNHPRVQAAVQGTQDYAAKSVEAIRQEPTCMYHLGLAVIFLADLDPITHRRTIERLLDVLWSLQKPHGGWGYPDQPTGDTSMSQYATLAIWTAHQADIVVPPDRVVRFAAWLTRTQDPSGAWGYQGIDPGEEDFQRVSQSEIRPSLAAAGLGSMYICLDLVDAGRAAPLPDHLPKVLTEIPSDQQGNGPVIPGALRTRMQRAVKDGDNWFVQNPAIEVPLWQHYYLYALERYHSFREAAQGSSQAEPLWYNQGVELLRSKQDPNGAWVGNAGADADTAFAILFLIRGAKLSLQRDRSYGAGRLLGGRGLPGDLRRLTLHGGNVVGPRLTTQAEDLLQMLHESMLEIEKMDARIDAIELSEDPQQRADQVAQLRRLIERSKGKTQLLAIRALSADDDFDNVPYFIFALASTDRPNVLAARDALMRLRRTFRPVGPPDQYTERQRRDAIRQWKEWYLSVDPNARLQR